MYENLSISGKIRYRLARILWPAAEPAALQWTYAGDGMATIHNCDFRDDPRFAAAYQQAKNIGAWHGADIEWRAYTVCWAALKARGLEGDFVECGVDRGGFSIAAMHYIDFASMHGRRWYLVDTYEGIPPETLEDDEHRELLVSRYDRTYDDVVRTFAPFPDAVVVRGKVPDVLPSVPAEKIAYLCIDLNTAAPSAAAAEFFWDRLVSGAPVIFDDYGQTFFRDMKSALDDFARRRGVEILALPTGQGLLFKP